MVILKGAWEKAKRELMTGILNLSPHQNVQTLECEQGYHTVKCLGSNSVKQFFSLKGHFSHHSCESFCKWCWLCIINAVLNDEVDLFTGKSFLTFSFCFGSCGRAVWPWASCLTSQFLCYVIWKMVYFANPLPRFMMLIKGDN